MERLRSWYLLGWHPNIHKKKYESSLIYCTLIFLYLLSLHIYFFISGFFFRFNFKLCFQDLFFFCFFKIWLKAYQTHMDFSATPHLLTLTSFLRHVASLSLPPSRLLVRRPPQLFAPPPPQLLPPLCLCCSFCLRRHRSPYTCPECFLFFLTFVCHIRMLHKLEREYV